MRRAKRRGPGRPADPNARRRATTRAGRRGEVAVIDRGSLELRRLRRRLTGDSDLPVDPLGVLLGRGLISQANYHTGRGIAEVIERVRQRLGVGQLSVQATWLAIIAGAGAIRGDSAGPSAASERWAVGQMARYARAIGEGAETLFDVCSGVWIPSGIKGNRCIVRAARNESLTPPERSLIDLLGRGLDAAAKVQPKPRADSNAAAA